MVIAPYDELCAAFEAMIEAYIALVWQVARECGLECSDDHPAQQVQATALADELVLDFLKAGGDRWPEGAVQASPATAALLSTHARAASAFRDLGEQHIHAHYGDGVVTPERVLELLEGLSNGSGFPVRGHA